MNLKGIENLTLAIASGIDDVHYIEVLLNRRGFIEPFIQWRREQLRIRAEKGETDPGTYADMVTYITCEHLDLSMSAANFSIYFEKNRDLILNNYFLKSRSELVTDVASRESILQVIKKKISMENRSSSQHRHIMSHVDLIKDMFLEVFRKDSAHAYQFDGSFVAFVVNSFQKFFWIPRKADIWKRLNAVDSLQLEVDKNITSEVEMEEINNDDLAIGELIQNIYSASRIFFHHSGHNGNMHGILSDIYYTVLVILCREKVDLINSLLESHGVDTRVRFIDVYSFREQDVLQAVDVELPVKNNKGLASKVTNAMPIVEAILGYVRKNKISPENIFSLAFSCFEKGKVDTEGKNSIWKNTPNSKLTVRRLGESNTITNYYSFDTVLRGVISVNTLMTKLQERGKDIITEYVPELFRNEDIVRSITYYSDLSYLSLISALQNVECPADGGAGLKNFDQLVTDIVGSSNNGTTEIRTGRQRARQSGLLGDHKRKQHGSFPTLFDKVASMAKLFLALPREYSEDSKIVEYIDDTLNGRAPSYIEQFSTQIDVSRIFPDRYVNLMRNNYLIKDEELAKTLLFYGIEAGKELPTFDRWTVALAGYDGIDYISEDMDIVGVYNPLTDAYVFEGLDNNGKPTLFSIGSDEFIASYNTNRRQGVSVEYSLASFENAGICTSIYNKNFAGNIEQQFRNALGFDTFIGIEGIDDLTTLDAFLSMSVYHEYQGQLLQFVKEFGELSRLQLSFARLAGMMFLEAATLMYSDDNKTAELGYSMYKSMLTKNFDRQVLNDFLEDIYAVYLENGEKMHTNIPGARGSLFERKEIDCTALRLVMGIQEEIAPTKLKLKSDEIEIGSKVTEFIRALNGRESPAERFVKLHSFIDCKITFIRQLRDAYEILFGRIGTCIPSYVCSMDKVLKIRKSLYDFVQDGYKEFVSLTPEITREQEWFISEVKNESCKDFRQAILILSQFVDYCSQSISNLTEYNILSGTGINKELKQWGAAFKIQGRCKGADWLPPNLGLTDEAGFYCTGSSHIVVRKNNQNYYIHSTGRLLVETLDGFKPFIMDFNNENQVAYYRMILSQAATMD